ncbi:hypothetical protein BJF78_20605 [Pseudonocardia sp. CNS-139]|nr:hypothetical protein BJF78_20605 [Pseudonocardia sp. CNS-139]
MLVAVLLTAMAGLCACTSTVGGSPVADPAPAPTEGPGSDPVAWVDQVCGAVLSFAVPATAAPDFSRTEDLPAVQRTVSDYLGSVVAGVQAGRTRLGTVGRSPVQGGDEAIGRTESAMQFLEQDFTGAKATMDAADPTDMQAFLGTLGQVESTLAAITPPDLLRDLSASPRLLRASERAAQCRHLAGLAAAVPPQ